jgi:hypothetical protein
VPHRPVYAGLWYAAHGRTAWLGFACPGHVNELIAPRSMLPGIVTSSSAVVTRGVTRARLLIAAGHREAARELLVAADRWYAANGAGEGADVARELLRQIEVVESC